jgi:hypothetical protein
VHLRVGPPTVATVTGGSRNSWGGVRKLPSGRFQAHYKIDYRRYVGPRTFRTKTEALAFLAATRADLERGLWVDPNASKISLADYSWTWLAQRQLRPRSRQLYEGLLRLHLLPTLGKLALKDVTSPRVRQWHADQQERFDRVWWYVPLGTVPRLRRLVEEHRADDFVDVRPWQGGRPTPRGQLSRPDEHAKEPAD